MTRKNSANTSSKTTSAPGPPGPTDLRPSTRLGRPAPHPGTEPAARSPGRNRLPKHNRRPNPGL